MGRESRRSVLPGRPRVRGPGEQGKIASGKSLVLPAPARLLPLLPTGNSDDAGNIDSRGTAKGRGLSSPALGGRQSDSATQVRLT
ncbi:hypothetical protein GLA29479_3412 [Lysobacter antibioticus]|uniref:Uncharacterized protein n=1 Tax=Lysobacter antibioticus TaxID=84531 RepID=A0A0S2FEU6_LYSAN|nr:hypothetical protein GLA29479_3412 [Lysobacter antibioticus]ALN82059.1 hypothetical protein LA76x_3938 [Lysobacter antibioticus]